MTRAGLVALLALALLAGCAAGPTGPAAEDDVALTQRPVVVAVIDTGLNPYHEDFRSGQGSAAEDWAFLANAKVLTLAQGDDHTARVEADLPLWESLEMETPYAFAGTRVIAMSFATGGSDRPVLDEDGHGTATASLIARGAPHALIVSLQVDGRLCTPPDNTGCLVDPSIARATQWASEQPWVDIISTSIGIPGNKPPVNEAEAEAHVRATRAAAASGKLVLNSAGNDPTPSVTDYFNGPPWIIAVGGANSTQGGIAAQSSAAIDVVADFSTTVATSDADDAYESTAGTSMSTPIVAAALAHAMHIANEPRPLAPERANEYRAAMNASALPLPTTGFAPAVDPSDPFQAIDATTIPLVIEGYQDGWGFIGRDASGRIAAFVTGAAAPPMPEGQRAIWMSEYQAARERAWGEGRQR